MQSGENFFYDLSPYVIQELEEAVYQAKPVIPILCEQFELEEWLKAHVSH